MAFNVVGAGPTPLTTTPAPIYTSAGVQTILRRVTFSNVTGTTGAPAAESAVFTVNVLRSGTTTDAVGNVVIPGQSVSAGAIYTSEELSGLVLQSGDSLQASATVAAAINVVVSGLTL